MLTKMELYIPNKLLCRSILLFPLKGESWETNKIKSNVMLVTIFVCLIPTVQAAIHQSQFEKVEVLIDVAFLGITTMGFLFMYFHFKGNAKKIMECMDKATDFLEFCNEDVLIRGEANAKSVTRSYFIFAASGWVINYYFCFSEFGTCYKHRKNPDFHNKHDSCGIPFRNWYPWDETQSFIYLVSFSMQTLGWSLIRMNIVTILATVIAFFIHITNQLSDLEEKVAKIFDEENQEKYKARMKFCNKYHIAILNYVGEVFDHLTMVFLGIFISVSAPVGIILFQFVIEDDVEAKVRAVYHFLGWTGILLLICYLGQKTLDQSTGIGDAIYSSEWHRSPITLRKNLQLLILRSQRPLVLSAGGVAVFSLDTFVSILKTAYSFFTLLVTTMSEEQ